MGRGNIRHISIKWFTFRTVGLLIILLVIPVSGAFALPIFVQDTAQTNLTTEIDGCTIIDEPGYYVLTEDLETQDDLWGCIRVEETNDVVIDGNGHKISNPKQAIRVINSFNVTIRGFVLEDIGLHGISVGDSKKVEIRNISAENVGDKDGGAPIWTWSNQNVKIINNNLTNNAYGIQVRRGSENVVIRNNEIANGVLCGMDVKNSKDIVIDNNTIIGQGSANLALAHSESIVVSDNVIEGSPMGIQIYNDTTNVSIDGNIIANATEYTGILLHSGANKININNNTIRGNPAAISMGNVTDINIHYNNIAQNEYGVRARSDASNINATYNWWGAPSGPSGHGPGSGVSVSSNVEFKPWLAPEATIQQTNLSETEVSKGDAVVLTVQITNTGTHAGKMTLGLLIDGEVVETSMVQLDIGESTAIRFHHQFNESGEYTIAVDDVKVGTISVMSESSPTSTREATPNKSMTEEEFTSSSAEGGQPGFGIVVALVAILIAMILARRQIK